MNYRSIMVVVTLAGLLCVSCDEQEPPSRKHLPELKARMSQLQVAFAQRDGLALDSLLSPRLRSDQDALLNQLHFIYGEDNSKGFTDFGEYGIFYSHRHANVDCFLVDSVADESRPVRLTLVLTDDRWLLDNVEERLAEEDSLTAPPPGEDSM